MKKMGFWKTFLACLLAIFIGSIVSFFLTILVFSGIVAVFVSLDSEDYKLVKQSVLTIDLSEPLIEVASTSFIDNIDLQSMTLRSTTTLYDAVAMVDVAATDPNIVGIYLKVTPFVTMDLSSMYELREALVRFRQNSGGKFVVAYGDTYSQGAVYLASAGDKIYLNPAGAVDWSGMSASVTFFKGALDKLGVEPEIVRHGKFKGAIEPFLLSKMSPENRLQNEQLLFSMWNNVVSQVAHDRSLSFDTLQMLASNLSIATARDAVKYGLVDSLLYRDQMQTNLEKLCGQDKLELISLSQYRRSGIKLYGNILSNDRVAIIYANGEIVDVAGSAEQIVGNELAATLRSVRMDDKIKAVVLRVNSPGGSALASEVIRREVELTRAAKPLVVSMGSYAASGGYWISCPADQIISTPMTLTGSIGVFGLLFNVEKGASEKLGVTFDVVKTNPSADMGSITRPMSRAELLVIQNSVDTIYQNFIENVAKGRSIDVTQVDSLGGGRVWSGLQAEQNKLVNSIGGLRDAVILAGEKAGLNNYRVVNVGAKAKSGFTSIFSALSSVSLNWIFGHNAVLVDQAVQLQNLLKEQGVKAVMEQKIVIH